jgi:ABC-type polysaccharide/polyol phosphate export permease
MARSAAFGKMDILTFEHIGIALLSSVIVFILGSMAFMRYERKAVKYL